VKSCLQQLTSDRRYGNSHPVFRGCGPPSSVAVDPQSIHIQPNPNSRIALIFPGDGNLSVSAGNKNQPAPHLVSTANSTRASMRIYFPIRAGTTPVISSRERSFPSAGRPDFRWYPLCAKSSSRSDWDSSIPGISPPAVRKKTESILQAR